MTEQQKQIPDSLSEAKDDVEMQIDTQKSTYDTKELARMLNALVQSNIEVNEQHKLAETIAEASKMLVAAISQQTNVQKIRDKLPSEAYLRNLDSDSLSDKTCVGGDNWGTLKDKVMNVDYKNQSWWVSKVLSIIATNQESYKLKSKSAILTSLL